MRKNKEDNKEGSFYFGEDVGYPKLAPHCFAFCCKAAGVEGGGALWRLEGAGGDRMAGERDGETKEGEEILLQHYNDEIFLTSNSIELTPLAALIALACYDIWYPGYL